MIKAKSAAIILVSLLALGCSSDGEIDPTGGIRVTRSACPAVAVPAATGDITIFNPETSRDASAIDVVATMTNVRGTCGETADHLTTTATFEVLGQRRNTQGAREVVLPYFTVVVHSGTNVVSKRVGRVALRFEDGQARASTTGMATAQVLRSAATLPEEIREQITRRRRPGEADAAIDPMADPAVRAAVARANFEVLVGFQLTEAQLAYNATR